MASEFQPTTFVFGDRAGQGMWEIGHARQHQRYVFYLMNQSVPILVADHPILTMGKTDFERKVWLQDHANLHNQLRSIGNITGIDLAAVDFTDRSQFTVWLDDHASEHSLIDFRFGLT